MNAKEMFEELGYKQDIPDDYDDITYSKPILDKDTFGYVDSEMISFIEKLHTTRDYTGVILSITDIETRIKINEIIDYINKENKQ